MEYRIMNTAMFDDDHFSNSKKSIEYQPDTYLVHYQIKGAKHGVRRFQNRDGSLTPLGRILYGVGTKKKSRSGLHKATSNTKKKQGPSKSVKTMSDQELAAAINRIRNEQTYAQLTSRKNVNIGKSIVKNIIAPVTQEIVKDVYREYAKQAIKDAVIPAVTYAGKKVLKKITEGG